MPDIYLASRSPRRRELLDQIGIAHQVVDGEIDEAVFDRESPRDYVSRLARQKAEAGALNAPKGALVLAADTSVVVDGEILGKPADPAGAICMLRRLSGRSHGVFTAVAMRGAVEGDVVSESRVTFRRIEEAEMTAYCATGEPLDKAGAYGIQGRAAVFVTHLAGSYSGVMGLPLAETADLLVRAGVKLFR